MTADPRQDPAEGVDNAAVQTRRVQSHYVVLQGMLKFMRERGAEAARVTQEAAARKAADGAAQSAPLYFDSADNQGPPPEAVINPPPCVQPRTVTLKLPRRRGDAVSTRVTALGKRARLKRGVAVVRLGKAKPGARVRVRIVQRVRNGKPTRTCRTTRTLKICAS